MLPSKMTSGLLALSLAPLPAIAQDATANAAELAALNAKIDVLFAELEELSSSGAASPLHVGGYGEYHSSFVKDGSKASDPHRFVLYLGYDFSDRISLHSEVELEHGFVAEGNGEVSLEQLYADLWLTNTMGLRFGRMLNPLGIINARHEPTTFNGVERPALETFIIPSTWSQDGLGAWGRLGEDVSYELQLTSGLDGSGFGDVKGIRGGRLNERPGLGDPALSGRLDWRPTGLDDLRLGASFYSGGADNGNKGLDPGVEARVDIGALDFEYSRGKLDLRGVLVKSHVTGAADLNAAFGNNVGKEQAGWYVEAGYHLLAISASSDLVGFLRLEEYDTLETLASGGLTNPAAARNETTVGLGWWLTPSFVLKADYQFLDDNTGTRPNQLNLGIGWTLTR
jgi:hypothetical protein